MVEQLIISNKITIHAPISRVWDALINPEQTKKYMHGCEVISNFTVGSSINWQASWEGKETIFVTGNVVAIEPETFLAYSTFDPFSEYENIPANHLTVTCRLSSEDETTLLTITQGDYAAVPNGPERYEEASSGGGWGPILLAIKDVIEINKD